MSRIGKAPIEIPSGVEVKIGKDMVEVKGPKGSAQTPLCPCCLLLSALICFY